MNAWSVSLVWRRCVVFGLAIAITASIFGGLNPRIFKGELSWLDWVAGGIGLLLLFTGVFNLLLYGIGFGVGSPGERPSVVDNLKASGSNQWSVINDQRSKIGDRTSPLSEILVSRASHVGSSGIEEISTRMAMVMPIYHEETEAVYERVRQTWLSVRRAGLDRHCDFYLLCDSTDPLICRQEEEIHARLSGEFSSDEMTSGENGELAILENRGGKAGAQGDGKAGEEERPLAERCDPIQSPIANHKSKIENPPALGRFFLVRREDRKNYKAGNIANFLENYGGIYDFMLVLDADSVMLGETIQRMILRMQGTAKLAILQSTIIPIRAVTPFARSMQYFHARCLPLFARGMYWFLGSDSVYWGHNALIRVVPFMAHSNLPIMPGKPPLGGRILSQDIVEAALLGRAGWSVEWDVESGGSFDEIPATLLSYGKRDRRWCQGNFQHFWLIFGDRMKLGHRMYFANGIWSYCAGPLLLVLACLGSAQITGAGMSAGRSIFEGGFLLFVFTMLALPRALGLLRLWRQQPTRVLSRITNSRQSGRLTATPQSDGTTLGACLREAAKEVISALAETLISILAAPLLFYLHARFVVEILTGKVVAWQNQSRNPAEGLSWSDAGRVFWVPSVLGAMWIGIDLSFVPPAILGQMLIPLCWLASIPLAIILSSPGLGLLLIKLGLFGDGSVTREREAMRPWVRDFSGNSEIPMPRNSSNSTREKKESGSYLGSKGPTNSRRKPDNTESQVNVKVQVNSSDSSRP